MKILQSAENSNSHTNAARRRIWEELKAKAATEIADAVARGQYLAKIGPHPHFPDGEQLQALAEELKRLGYAVAKSGLIPPREEPHLLVSWRQPRETPTS